MSFACTTPDEKYGTLAELNGSLIGVEHGTSPAMQELVNTPIYPSIQFEPIEPVSVDFVNYQTQEKSERSFSYMEKVYDEFLDICKQQLGVRRHIIESTPAFKQAKEIYNYINSYFLKAPGAIFEDALFKKPQEIRGMAWHPHVDTLLAVAHKDNKVYIYEKKGTEWTCQVLAHQKQTTITCLEWKPRSSDILAVGCEKGVCVWTLERLDGASKRPKYHPHAFMRYFPFPELISSLAWDPTPASHLLAVVSADSNALVIHDTLLNRTIPLKRYGRGNILLRWSPSGEFLFEGGSSGISRMWDTSDWSSQQIRNPPGLWIQAASWSPDNRTLVYSMCGKSDIHALFLTGKSVKLDIRDIKILSTSTGNVYEESGSFKVTVGGVIRDMTIDQRNGQRLAVVFENSPLIALYTVKRVSPLNLRQNPMLFPIGYIRGAQSSYPHPGANLDIVAMDSKVKPTSVMFSSAFKDGALLAVAWDDGAVTFVTHQFLTDEQVGKRFM